MLIFIYIFLQFIPFSTSQKSEAYSIQKRDSFDSTNTESQQKENLYAKSVVTYSLFLNSDTTWGYNIYIDGQQAIYQPNIPGAPGNKGFKKNEEAMKIANRVVEKIKQGKFPPTITKEDFKNLNINY